MEHNILLIGDSFNWVKIVSCNLRDEIEKYQKTLSSANLNFYMSWFFMDAFCVYSPFLTLNWFQKEEFLPINIYLSNIWEDKFIPQVYELCDLFIGSMYFKFFKVDAPALSKGARELI